MSKLRGVGITLLLVGVIAALVPTLGLAGPSEVTVRGTPSAASDNSQNDIDQGQNQDQGQDQDQEQGQNEDADSNGDGDGDVNEGPAIDPDDEAEGGGNDVLIGLAALVLLGIVVGGRRVRTKRRNPAKG